MFPTEDMELTHILVTGDLERSRRFYTDVLGADLYREYVGSSLVLRFPCVPPPQLLLRLHAPPSRLASHARQAVVERREHSLH